MFEDDLSHPDPTDSDPADTDPADSDPESGETGSAGASSDGSARGRPLSDEFELTVGDSLIIGGQTVVIIAIADGEVTFEIADGFAFDRPDAESGGDSDGPVPDTKSRPPR